MEIDKEYNCEEDMKNPLLCEIVSCIDDVKHLRVIMGTSNGRFYTAKVIEKLVLDYHNSSLKRGVE